VRDVACAADIEVHEVTYQLLWKEFGEVDVAWNWPNVQRMYALASRLLLAPRDEQLLVRLPKSVAETAWDVILVDSPAKLRVESLWTTRRLLNDTCGGGVGGGLGPCRTSSGRVHVLVHDADRKIEASWADALFGEHAAYVAVEGVRGRGGFTQVRRQPRLRASPL
jgi:hypothetical protein